MKTEYLGKNHSPIKHQSVLAPFYFKRLFSFTSHRNSKRPFTVRDFVTMNAFSFLPFASCLSQRAYFILSVFEKRIQLSYHNHSTRNSEYTLSPLQLHTAVTLAQSLCILNLSYQLTFEAAHQSPNHTLQLFLEYLILHRNVHTQPFSLRMPGHP